MAIINLILSIILGNKIGLLGILLATTIARLTTNVWYDAYILYKIVFNKSSKDYFIQYFKNILIILFTIIIIYFFIKNLIVSTNIYICFVIKLLICIIMINLCFLIIFYNKYEFKYIKNYVSILIKNNSFIKNKLKN